VQLLVLSAAADESALEEQEPPTRADLIAASDVFLYMGDLQPVFSAAHAFLAPKGLLAFTLERITDSSSSGSSGGSSEQCSAATAAATATATASSDGTVDTTTASTADTTGTDSSSVDSKVCRGWVLQKSGRFAHTRQYVEQLAAQTGFTVVHYAEHSPRTEGGKAIPGHLFVLQTTATTGRSIGSERTTSVGYDDDELLNWH
jgi:predicted TPR repeat methyltransferase